jgi:hypothetical protein
MFCPRCGSTQDAELKFCTACGANLYAVRKVVDTRKTGKKRELGKPWFAEIALSDAASKRRQEELDHRRGIAPEVRRYNEIKAGIITGSAGLGVSIVLFILMQGIILGANVSPGTAQILGRLWIAGVIPFLVGLALLANGMFVSKRLAEVVRRASQPESQLPQEGFSPLNLGPSDTAKMSPSNYSITENTTQHLGTDRQKTVNSTSQDELREK